MLISLIRTRGASSIRVLRHSLPATATIRPISTSVVNFVKKIVAEEDGDNITVEGVSFESDRTPYLVKLPDEEKDLGDHFCKSCPWCRLNIKNLAFSDVLILNQFINSDGSMMYREETGLCWRAFYLIKRNILLSQKARLLPRPPDYVVYGEWDNLNRYYEFPRRIRDQPTSVIRKEYWDNSINQRRY